MRLVKPRQQPQIDWNAQFAAADRARAQQAQVDEQARHSAFVAAHPADPVVEKFESIEARLTVIEQHLGIGAIHER
jgi:hypothetical protein